MRILVVGAGLAGLATCRALSLRGFDATIVERSTFPGSGGAGLFLPGNAVRAAGELGLLAGVLANSQPIRQQRFCDETGQLLNIVDTDDFWRDVGPCRAMKRSAMWDLLCSSVGAEKIRNHRVATLTNRADGCDVHFEDGETAAYDLVIGADGVNSTVRRAAFPDAPLPVYVGNLCWRMVVPNVCRISSWTVSLATDRSLLGIPVSATELYLYADLAADESAIAPCSASTALVSLFGDMAGPLSPALQLSANADMHFGALMRLRMDAVHRNRVVLVGDAAHASPPSMAQGAAMAFEDALVLADELAHANDIKTALARHEARRKPRVDWVHRQTSVRDRMRRLPRAIRNLLLAYGGNSLYQRSYHHLTAPI
ncbi:FAD-dependent monooxygenase [Fertoebacter nigrum]|uniref:FAD-dependent monooxygenase n=1 Tax=Fertoeibacter niger TaxID=2656921 RepID=A0A8X8KS13_9RHOB|nr:FAD-dependent oxidoreductase [Fertoeibacter niger]NUB45892.1 FAD-dependent monooxygenase [Fertoeibacter niger]